MSRLAYLEKNLLEKILGMNTGYVSDFSDRTFKEFVLDYVDIDIYEKVYEDRGTSKANRLRTFWDKQSDENNAYLIEALLEYAYKEKTDHDRELTAKDEHMFVEARKIVQRLKDEAASKPAFTRDVEDVDALVPNSSGEDFESLLAFVKEAITKEKYDEALDRLHTYVVRYLRNLCKKHGQQFDKKTPLNALMGGYVKSLRDQALIESEMTMEILKSSIKIMEKFDSVRNEQSFAHDNKILNKEESRVIVGYVSSTLVFLQTIERKREVVKEAKKIKTKEDEEIEAAGDLWIQMEIDRMRGK